MLFNDCYQANKQQLLRKDNNWKLIGTIFCPAVTKLCPWGRKLNNERKITKLYFPGGCLRKIKIGLLDEGLHLFISDVDECNNGSHDCHSNATCINTAGYFKCKCKDGYIGDRRNCKGRDQLKHIVFSIYFKYFWPCNFKKLYLCRIKLYLIGKDKK